MVALNGTENYTAGEQCCVDVLFENQTLKVNRETPPCVDSIT